MNLNFNLHAIIKFELMGFAEPIYKIGKVINVSATEVAIIPQLKVYHTDPNSIHERLDQYCTADADCIIHIRRSLIASWTYAKATDYEIRESISENQSNLLNDKKFKDYKLNFYDYRTGFFKGDGSNCSYISENS